MRTLKQLIDRDDPGIALLRGWAAEDGANATTILPPDGDLASETLLRLQVTTRSLLGAVSYETGGVLVDDGLIRLFGSGPARSLLRANRSAGLLGDGRADDVVLVGDDVFGGLFALNGGRFGPEGPGEVFHLPADETRWSPLEVGYADFVSWCVTGDLLRLYSTLAGVAAFARRPRPPIDKSYSFYPFLWTAEGRDGEPDAREIDADELLRLRLDLSGFEAA